MKFIVELEAGVWASDVLGDPGRTIIKENATIYGIKAARNALLNARKLRPFENAKLEVRR